ncbi:MAG: hypothetical protein NVS3B9_2480 [Candidatus Doudnabacteria bacterium]
MVNRTDVIQFVDAELIQIKNMGANCVAVGTPYDPEFLPYMRVWVNEARKNGLRVWFRGNLSGWEGWFNYPRFVNTEQHHRGITKFIKSNPDLFVKGDIFTPAPEPENGILGDPRALRNSKSAFLKFITDSYTNCTKAFSEINKNVDCRFSFNGDIAKDILTPEVVKGIGNIGIDHYLKNPDQYSTDITFLNKKYNSKVFIGEFGAPVPNIHGSLTEQQQADFVEQSLRNFALNKNLVGGVNYWVLKGGSTALLRDDSSSKPAVKKIQNYFMPGVLKGVIQNTLGEPLSGEVRSAEGNSATDNFGKFKMILPAKTIDVSFRSEGYKENYQTIEINRSQSLSEDIYLEPKNPTLFYKIKLLGLGLGIKTYK